MITSYCKKNEKLKLSIQIPSLKENLSEFLAKLPDLVVDTPKAEDYTIKIISKLIKDDLINVEDLNQLTEKLKQMENEYSEITSELLISKIKNNLTEIKGNDDTQKNLNYSRTSKIIFLVIMMLMVLKMKKPKIKCSLMQESYDPKYNKFSLSLNDHFQKKIYLIILFFFMKIYH